MASTWTCDFLDDNGWYRLPGCIQCLRWVFRAGSSRRWSGSIGQYNLLKFCSRDKTKPSAVMAKKMGLAKWWNKRQSSGSTLQLSKEVRELLFQQIRLSLESAYKLPSEDVSRSRPEEPTVVVLHKTLRFGAEFQEEILIWHIATDIILLDSNHKLLRSSSSSTHGAPAATGKAKAKAKAIKALSDYMQFLVAIRGYMLPSLSLQSLYEATRDNLEKLWNENKGNCTKDREAALAGVLKNKVASGIALPAGVLADGAKYAVALLRRLRGQDWTAIMRDVQMPTPSEARLLHWIQNLNDESYAMTPDDLLDFMLDVWVRMLIYTSTRCSTESHAKQLSRGGDLATVVWMLAEHAGMFSSYINDSSSAPTP